MFAEFMLDPQSIQLEMLFWQHIEETEQKLGIKFTDGQLILMQGAFEAGYSIKM